MEGPRRRGKVIVLWSSGTIIRNDRSEGSLRMAFQNDLEALSSPSQSLSASVTTYARPILLSRRSILLDQRWIDTSPLEAIPSTLATFRSRRDMRDRCCVMEAANKPTDSKSSSYRIVHYTAKQEQSEHLIVQQAISDGKTSRPAVAKNASVGKIKSLTAANARNSR